MSDGSDDRAADERNDEEDVEHEEDDRESDTDSRFEDIVDRLEERHAESASPVESPDDSNPDDGASADDSDAAESGSGDEAQPIESAIADPPEADGEDSTDEDPIDGEAPILDRDRVSDESADESGPAKEADSVSGSARDREPTERSDRVWHELAGEDDTSEEAESEPQDDDEAEDDDEGLLEGMPEELTSERPSEEDGRSETEDEPEEGHESDGDGGSGRDHGPADGRLWDRISSDRSRATADQSRDESKAGVGDAKEEERSAGDDPISAEDSRFDEGAERARDAESSVDDLAELDRIGSESHVLVVDSGDHSVADRTCNRLLNAGNGSGRNVLFVTTSQPAAERIQRYQRTVGSAIGEIAVTEVGIRSGGTPIPSQAVDGLDEDSVTVKHVSNPSNLSRLGIVITQLLSEWESAPRPPVMCFHSLTAFRQHVNDETLFRFVNLLNGRLDAAGARGHYHLRPQASPDLFFRTIRPLFDTVVRISVDGELEVETG